MTKTYAQLAKEIQALQVQAETLRKAETQGVIAKLNESIARYSLSAQDLHFPGNGASSSNSSASASGAKRHSGASSRAANASSDDAKYSDGPGRVWGGRGPRPTWLREAMAQGRSLESFAVTRKTRRAADASTPAKVSLPPLYSHPKTGQTWSGRGPKPAWLKQGLKKRGASIDDFLISARESNAESAPIDATQTAAPHKTTSAGRVSKSKSKSKGANRTQAKTSDKAVAQTPAQKTGKHTQDKTTPQATPTAAPVSPATAPVKKAANGKSARAAGSAPSSTQTATPAKKAAAPAKAQAGKGRKTAKPPVKKTAPGRKNMPASMAPPPEMPTPAPSVEPTAAPVVSPTQFDAPSAPETTSTP